MRSRAAVATSGGAGGMSMAPPSSPSMRSPAPRSRNAHAMSPSSTSGGRPRRPATPPRGASHGYSPGGYGGGGQPGGGRRASRKERRSWTSTLCVILLGVICFAGGVTFNGRGGSKDQSSADGALRKATMEKPDTEGDDGTVGLGAKGVSVEKEKDSAGNGGEDDDDDDDATSTTAISAKERAIRALNGQDVEDDDDDDVPSLKKARKKATKTVPEDDDDDDQQAKAIRQKAKATLNAGEKEEREVKKKKKKEVYEADEEVAISSAAVGRRDLLEAHVVPLVDDDDDGTPERPLVLPGRGPRHSPEYLGESDKLAGGASKRGKKNQEATLLGKKDDPEARNIHNVPFQIPVTWGTIGDPKETVKKVGRKHTSIRKNLRGDDPPNDGYFEKTTNLRAERSEVGTRSPASTFTKTFGAAASLMGVKPDEEMSKLATSRRKSRTLAPAVETSANNENAAKKSVSTKTAKTKTASDATTQDEATEAAKTKEVAPKKGAPGFPEEEDKLREPGKDSDDAVKKGTKKTGAGTPMTNKEASDTSASGGRDGVDTSSIKNQLKRQTGSAAGGGTTAARSSAKKDEDEDEVEQQIKVQTDADGDAKHHVVITFEQKGETEESDKRVTPPAPPSVVTDALTDGAGAATSGKMPKLPMEDDDDDDKVGTAKEGIKQQMNHVSEKVSSGKPMAKPGKADVADDDDDDDTVGMGGGTVGGGAVAVLTEGNRGGADTTAKTDATEEKVVKRSPPKELRNQLGGDTTSENVKLPSDADRATEKERPASKATDKVTGPTPVTKTT